jgi:2-polyprenyl-3-methyl-5-hydroxy-6-metoxy-1,4-benzoquinol methylase
MDIKSPVTHTNNTSLVTEFDMRKIISLYKDIGIETERFFNGTNAVTLHQCNDTGYRFYYPFTIFGDDTFYEDLYTNISGYYKPDRWEYSFAISHIPPHSRVLEIGCGAGLFLQQLAAKNCETTGLELNHKAVNDCRKKGLNVHDELIESFAAKKKEYFDIVCSFQVLEHVKDVKSFIESALVTLKPGGKLIISVPNSNPYFLGYDKYHTLNLPPHHSGLWNKSSLEKIASVFPLEMVEVKAEPLKEFKEWFEIHRTHYQTTKPVVAFFMRITPRPVYKFLLKLFSSSIEGSFITAIYKKK